MKTGACVSICVVLLVVSLAYLSHGWASVTVTHVDDNDKSDGVHFYEPRPYLLVTKTEAKDANGIVSSTLTNQIIWLPDHSRRYKVEIKSGLGSVNGSVKLQNGWMLDTLGAQTDSKIPETIAAVGGLVTAAIPKVQREEPSKATSTVALYLIDIGTNGTVWFEKKAELTP